MQIQDKRQVPTTGNWDDWARVATWCNGGVSWYSYPGDADQGPELHQSISLPYGKQAGHASINRAEAGDWIVLDVTGLYHVVPDAAMAAA